MLSYEIVGPPADSPHASAVTLLCLHGNSSHRGVWRFVAGELREFRCVLLDFHGHGDSEHIAPPAYNPEHHAADLARFVASLARGPYAILAHSAGEDGIWAPRQTRDEPRKIGGVVLICHPRPLCWRARGSTLHHEHT